MKSKKTSEKLKFQAVGKREVKMKNIKRKSKVLTAVILVLLMLSACQNTESQKDEDPNFKTKQAIAEQKLKEERQEQQKKKEEEEKKVAEEREKEKEKETEEKKREEENKAAEGKKASRQSTRMKEYTKKEWSPELEEALKDLDFSMFHFDVNEPVQIKEINNLFVLANKANYFPDSFEPIDLVDPKVKHAGNVTRRQLRKQAAEALEQLIFAAKEAGQDIQSVSGYRTIAYQKTLYKYNVERQGLALANQYSSKPGHSEHHTGLCMDVSSPSVGFDLIESYGNTKEGIWLAENAHKFGFIIRYPKGKEEWTGYSYEPWHIRYLGLPLAEYLYTTGLCYEEFLGLQQGKMPEEIKIIWKKPENTEVIPKSKSKEESSPLQETKDGQERQGQSAELELTHPKVETHVPAEQAPTQPEQLPQPIEKTEVPLKEEQMVENKEQDGEAQSEMNQNNQQEVEAIKKEGRN